MLLTMAGLLPGRSQAWRIGWCYSNKPRSALEFASLTFLLEVVLLSFPVFPTSEARAQTTTEYLIATPGSRPASITAGPDGNLWFTNYGASTIGRITPSGVITEFAVSSACGQICGITTGPDGALWFAETGSNKIGRITTAGALTEFSVPDPAPVGVPIGITSGPDGALWFTTSFENKVGRITTAGAITQFSVPTPFGHPYGITTGPDGALWFAEVNGERIGRITTAGVITEFLIPTPASTPYATVTGPDGAIWFTENFRNKIGRITTAGVITEFPIPTVSSSPQGITVGPDGALWFTESNTNKIGRITTAGVITEFTLATPDNFPIGIAMGPDEALWFTLFNTNKIGRLPLTIDVSKPSFNEFDAAVMAAIASPMIFRGGTLKPTIDLALGQPVTIRSQGGTVDTSSGDLTLSGIISGPGALTKVGAGVLTLSGANDYLGATTVNGGILQVDGSIASSSLTTVNAQGMLTGVGTVGNTTVGSGGILSPGNGTPGSFMTVAGSLAMQSGAMYLVQIDPTTASFVNVTGTAMLGGASVNATYANGSYVPKQYTILSASGGVGGAFNTLANTNLPGGFKSSLSYDGNNVFLDLALDFTPTPTPTPNSGLNVNQTNVANALTGFFNRTGGIPLMFGTLTPAGLTVASGELGTGIIQTAIKADDMFLNLMLDPSVAGRAGGFASGGPGASQFAVDDDAALAYAGRRKASPAERDAYAMATKAPYLAAHPLHRWSVWGAAYGGSAVTGGNTIVGSHDTTSRAYGVVGGADYRVSPDALIGFALAGGATSYSVAEALGSGRSDLFQAGVFGRQNIGAAYLSAALAYGWHDVTTNRTVALAGADVLQAKFRAETFSARFEGGYRFATPLAGITPYVAAQAISFNLPAYAEQVLAGTGTFALNYGAQTTTASRTELGLRTDKSFAMQNGIFTLRGRAAWAHDYNSDRAVTAVFQTLPGAAFVVNGARANPDGALVSAGAEINWLNGFSLAATFEGEFSGNTTSYAGKGVARYTW